MMARDYCFPSARRLRPVPARLGPSSFGASPKRPQMATAQINSALDKVCFARPQSIPGRLAMCL